MTLEMRILGPEGRLADAKSCTLAVIRQRPDETVEQAFVRHYAERPEDVAAGQTVFLYTSANPLSS
jgi:hypothetical protein